MLCLSVQLKATQASGTIHKSMTSKTVTSCPLPVYFRTNWQLVTKGEFYCQVFMYQSTRSLSYGSIYLAIATINAAKEVTLVIKDKIWEVC